MDALSTLIASELRKPGNSLRTMEARARAAGHKLSRSQIDLYARGLVKRPPTPTMVAALAAALGCPPSTVAEAARLTFGLVIGPPSELRQAQRSQAWLRLTDDRSDAEVEELLLIVEQVLRMRDMDGTPRQ